MESAYDYDPNELATSETNTHTNFGQFDQMRHIGPAQLQGGFQQPVRETGYNNQSRLPTEFDSVQLEYESCDNQLRAELPHPQSHFHSKLRPPRFYHHNTQHPSSTLPPIHNIREDGGILKGKVHQTLSKPPSQLPTIIHTKAKTYAGRSNRLGYVCSSLFLPPSLSSSPFFTLSFFLIFSHTQSTTINIHPYCGNGWAEEN